MDNQEPPIVPVEPMTLFPTGRNMLAIFLLLLCAWSAIPNFFGGEPNSIERQLPQPFIYMWAIMLAVGPIVTIVGIMWRNLITGIGLEQIGCWMLGGGAIIYGVAVITYNHAAGLQSGALLIVFGLFCLARVWQLWRWVKKNEDRLIRGV